MAATLSEVKSWIVTAKELGVKYLISVCDTYDYSDYPVYASDDEQRDILIKELGDMQVVNEVILMIEAGINPEYHNKLIQQKGAQRDS